MSDRASRLGYLLRRDPGRPSPSAHGLEWSHFRRQLLVVCHGNMCRSPLAAALLTARLPADTWHVFSAGTHAVEGQPVAGRTLKVATEFGIDLLTHRSRLLERDQVRYSGLILTMSGLQADVVAQVERGAASRIRLLGAFAPAPNLWRLQADPQQDAAREQEIGDPIAQSSDLHRQCFERLDLAVHEVVEWLKQGAVPADAPATADQWLGRGVTYERREPARQIWITTS